MCVYLKQHKPKNFIHFFEMGKSICKVPIFLDKHKLFRISERKMDDILLYNLQLITNSHNEKKDSIDAILTIKMMDELYC